MDMMTKCAGNLVGSPANVRGGWQPPRDVADNENSSGSPATFHRSVEPVVRTFR